MIEYCCQEYIRIFSKLLRNDEQPVQGRVYLNYKYSIEMEAFQPKWRCFHENSKNLVQLPHVSAARFRSSSKDSQSCRDNMEKSISSIVSLLSPKGKQRTIRQAQPIEYYQVNGKEDMKKVDEYLRDPCLLKKQLTKIGENRPQDKIVLDSATTLISNYEQKIKALQQEQAKHQRHTRKKDIPFHEVQSKANNGVQISSKKSFGSEKTVESLPSGKTLADVKSICASNYYFPDQI